jgi:hypothetical protein
VIGMAVDPQICRDIESRWLEILEGNTSTGHIRKGRDACDD